MGIKDKLDTLNGERTQRNKVFEARAAMQRAREAVNEANAEIQGIVNSGVFDTIDAEVKTVMVAGWDVIKAAKTGFGVTDIATLLDWRP